MYRTVIFFVLSVNFLVHSVPDYENDNYNIIINNPISSYGDNFEINQTFVVLLNQPFNITLVDYLSAGAICRSKRHSYLLTWYVEVIKFNAKWNSVIKVPRAKESMSTEWKCTLGRKTQADQVITFKVRVKGTPKIKVTIGGLELKNSLSHSSELEYDNIANYWYEDGETIDLVCHNLNVGFLYLVYYNQNGTKLIETARMLRQRLPNFKKTMRIEDHYHVIDCKYQLYEFHYGYTYRVIFKYRPEPLDKELLQEDSLEVRKQKMELLKNFSNKENREGLDEAVANITKRNIPVKVQGTYGTKLSVNKLTLVPINISADGNIEHYQYKFFENELVRVTCEKNKDLLGDLQFDADNNAHITSRIHEEVQNDPWKKTITLNTTGMTLNYLRCDIVGYLTANLSVIMDTTELYILGLPPKNVLYEYNNDLKTWIIDYRYSMNETLNLTCVARSMSDIQWTFGNNSVNSTIKSKTFSHEFTLEEDNDGMTITCEAESLSDKQKVIVILHRDERKTENIEFNITPVIYYNFSETKKIFVILENRPFNITLINYNATEAKCCQYYRQFNCFPTELENILEEDKWYSIIKVSEAVEDMSRVWKCNIKKNDSSNHDIIFDLRVKGTNNVNVTVAGIKLKTSVRNPLELEYDAMAHYWYEEGEAIDLSCINLNVGGTIRLSYYARNGTKLIETDPLWQWPISFRKTMQATNNGDMIDCIYKTEYYHYRYTHRTVFQLKTNTSANRHINVKVNNLKLLPIRLNNKAEGVYQYNIVEGQKLMVTCEKDSAVPGPIRFDRDDDEVMECGVFEEPHIFQNQNLELRKKSVMLNTKHIDQRHLKCNVKDFTADITFLLETRELSILGLSTSGIINQYIKNRFTWIIDYITEERMVHLTCVARTESHLLWIVTNSSEEIYNNFKNIRKEDLNKTKTISKRFSLNPELSEMSIACEAVGNEPMYTQRVIVNLRRTTKTLEVSETPDDDTNINTSNHIVVIIVSFSVVTLISVFGITVVCCMCFRKKDASASQDAPPANPHRLRPLPDVPRQAQYSYDYVYSSSEDADVPPAPTRNNSNEQNTVYYWACQ